MVECNIMGSGTEKKEDQNGLTVFEEVTDEQRLTVLSSNKDAVKVEFIPKLGK